MSYHDDYDYEGSDLLWDVLSIGVVLAVGFVLLALLVVVIGLLAGGIG